MQKNAIEKNIKIIIADDHALFAEGLEMLIRQNQNLSVVGIASDGRELLAMIKAHPPDLVLLDINMPDINGFDAIRFLKMHSNALKIIVLSTYAEMHVIAKARELGVNGYILKTSNRNELIEAVQAVMIGGSSFPDVNLPFVTDQDSGDPFLQALQLSAREKEILQLIKQGKTNKEISIKLFLSLYTVETHRKNIMRKLKLKSPAALIKFIIENNL